ncbi:hypothetical protein J4G33_03855 [Actinotalea sp. BY-33]|uniref:Uncharacterized protein n=1 Tax=Actinotalea soli TaxID=2819234 RepID=A0A939LNC9_9CELL|nr:hypothetical protein [Actinotalea soli]MBO1750931.1 hypothetical protein [Actinotalea soli]
MTPTGRPLRLRLLLGPLGAVSGALVVTGLVLHLVSRPDRAPGPWLEAFALNQPGTVPAMWRSLLFVTVAGAAAVLAAVEQGRRRRWVVTVVVSTLLGLDGMLRWHEDLLVLLLEDGQVGQPVVWAIVGLLISGGVALLVRWGRGLPAAAGRLVPAGVLVLVLGAVLGELASTWALEHHGDRAAFISAVAVEESLEMTGCLLVAAGLLRMLRVHHHDGTRCLVMLPSAGPSG